MCLALEQGSASQRRRVSKAQSVSQSVRLSQSSSSECQTRLSRQTRQ